MIDADALRLVMPQCQRATLDGYTPFIVKAMEEANICTVTRAAAFVAQLAHESAELRYMQELASGEAYEGRKDLGNVHVGDGKRYKGRGPIQLTGRTNYQRAGQALSLDLEGQPQLAALPEVGFRVAAWFWTAHNLNQLADFTDFRGITKTINGGVNGLAERTAYYYRALEVFGRDAILLL